MTTVKTTSIIDEVRTLLNNRPASLTLQTISTETGFSTAWLRLLMKEDGKFGTYGPGARAIESVIQFIKTYKPSN